MLLCHIWSIQIIAVWNTAARICLEREIPEAHYWKVTTVSNYPILNARHPSIESGFMKFDKLPSHHYHAAKLTAQKHEPPPLLPQASQNLVRKVKDWKTWAYTDGSYQVHQGKQVIGVGIFTTPTARAPTGVTAAVLGRYTHIATDSLASLRQLRKQRFYPELHRYHVQGDILKIIAGNLSATHLTPYTFPKSNHMLALQATHAQMPLPSR